MRIISSTAMRKDIAEIINEVKYTGQVLVLDAVIGTKQSL